MARIVEPAIPGSVVDTAAKLHADAIHGVARAGYSCIIRYVPHVGSTGALDIDSQELGAILDGGLALMLVQHVRAPGWDPASFSGTADAARAVEFARNAGYSEGAHLFVDLEGISGTGSATKKFAEDWASRVRAGGYLAGAYVGYAVPLTAQELYLLHGINTYWSDLGPRHVATRGFAMKQHATISLNGIPYDPDTIQRDARGETPIWMTSAPDVPNV
jgi:hypothetical protein